MEGRTRAFATVVAKNWVGWLCGRLAGALTLAVLARTFSNDDLGHLMSAVAGSLLISSLALGSLPDILAREISNASGEASRNAIARASSGAAGRAMLFAVPVSALMLFIGKMPLGIAAGLVVLATLQSMNLTLSAVPRARNQGLRYVTVSGNLSSVLRLGLALFGLSVGLTPTQQISLFALAEVFVVVVAVVCAFPLSRASLALDATTKESAVGIIWPVLSNADVLILQLAAGASAAGLYGPVMRLGEFTTQAALAIAAPYLPAASRLIRDGRIPEAAVLYRLSARSATAVTLPVVSVLLVGADFWLKLFLGDSTAAQTLAFRILLLGYLLHVAAGQTFGTLLALRRYSVLAKSSFGICLAYTGFLLWSATQGIVETGLVTAVAYVAANAIWASQLHRTSGTFLDGRALLVSVACLVISFSLLPILAPAQGLLATLVAASLAGALTVPLLVIPVVRELKRRATSDPTSTRAGP